MTRDSNDFYLWVAKKFSDFNGRLNTIHNRHTDVRQYNIIAHTVLLGIDNLFYGLFSSDATVNPVLGVNAEAL